MRATLRVALGVEILRCMMGRVCSSSRFFDLSLVPFWGTRTLFTRATTDAVCEFLSRTCHILTLRMVFIQSILLLVELATKSKDMSIPTEKNTSVKVTEKLSKYKDLEIEIERMWRMKATTIPVVIGALGLIKKGLEKYTKQIPSNIKISELQKIALLGTSRILRKTLSIK